MKKILLFFVALLCSFGAVQAQDIYVATLQHGDAVTQYYGGGAFGQAYNAAEDGDVITLSPGTFSSPGNFAKGITVRGTGIDAIKKTFISGDVRFYSNDEAKVTNVEGIVFNSYVYIYNDAKETSHGKINFVKNRFVSYLNVYQNGSPTLNGPIVRFYNSLLHRIYIVDNSNPDIIFYNCYTVDIQSNLTKQTNTSFINCVGCCPNYSDAQCSYLNFFNCIFINPYGRFLSRTATCYNCINVDGGSLFREIVSGENNKEGIGRAIFKTYSGSYNYGETFELTDEAKTKYLGTDGTQVGMQGGKYPYNSTVQYPIITKFEAAPQTTKEGKLGVEVQVDGK